MSDVAGVGHGLRPAAFVFGAGDTILRPDLHGHTDDVVALLTQEIPSDTGIHSAAHAEENALFFGGHWQGDTVAYLGANSICSLRTKDTTDHDGHGGGLKRWSAKSRIQNPASRITVLRS